MGSETLDVTRHLPSGETVSGGMSAWRVPRISVAGSSASAAVGSGVGGTVGIAVAVSRSGVAAAATAVAVAPDVAVGNNVAIAVGSAVDVSADVGDGAWSGDPQAARTTSSNKLVQAAAIVYDQCTFPLIYTSYIDGNSSEHR
jgi:hypothetical protein